ncbi:MAG: HDOD domain-containing protein [Planctomycetaceae bacterium]|nr:HDOD domain-containing protein [Planctomycetaceae bacterium]
MSLLAAVLPWSAAQGSGTLKEYVLRRADDFRMIPAAAMKALEIGRNPACSVAEYAAAIERDHRLTIDLLGMANSSLFARGAPATSLNDAVRRLGMRRCHALILSTCTAGLMRSLPFEHAEVREALWRHGYLTAVVCRHLNETLRLGFSGEEFTAGLLHDLGRSLLAATVPSRFSAVESDTDEPGADILDREREALGTDHCELGTAFAVRNGLPASLIAVIQHHHRPHEAKELQKLVAVVAIADHMANRIENCPAPEADEEPDNPFISFLAESDRVRAALDDVTPTMANEALIEAQRLIA